MVFDRGFRALSYRTFQLFFAGQLVSISGSWMQLMVQSWLIYRLTGSAAWVGALAFASQVMAFVVSPIAGALADKWDRRKILLWSEFLGFLQSGVLALMMFTGSVESLYLVLLSLPAGIVTGFELTTRHALTADLVPREALGSAIALNSGMLNASRIVGPALGGLLLSVLSQNSEAWCFAMNSLSYLFVCLCLLVMKIPAQHAEGSGAVHESHTAPYFKELISYLREQKSIRQIYLFVGILSALGFTYSVIFTVISKTLLQGDAQTLAWLNTAGGLGAIISAFQVQGRQTESDLKDLKAVIYKRMRVLGLCLLVVSNSNLLGLSLAMSFLIGYCLMGTFPLLNTAVQLRVQDALRGRVMSLYMMIYLIGVPVGQLLMGFAIDHWGLMTSSVLVSALCVATTFF